VGCWSLLGAGARSLDEFAGLFSEEAEHPYLLDQLKQLGFYTDCLGAAHWSEPERVIDEKLATTLVRTAQFLAKPDITSAMEIELWVKHIAPVWNQEPSWMRKALENWYEDMQRHGLAPLARTGCVSSFVTVSVEGAISHRTPVSLLTPDRLDRDAIYIIPGKCGEHRDTTRPQSSAWVARLMRPTIRDSRASTHRKRRHQLGVKRVGARA